MALKKCKECGSEISSTAKQCPNCGKEQRNIITKHPIISIILLIWILGIVISIVSPKSNYPATITTKENNSQSTAKNIQINSGDIITGKDWEINIESVQFAQKVEPPVKNMFYEYYQVDDTSNTYLYLILNCKNLSTLDLEATSVARVTAKCNNSYTYSSFSTVPDDTLGFTYTSLTRVKPLTSKKIYYLAEMPKKMSEEATTIDIYIEFENQTYTYKYR